MRCRGNIKKHVQVKVATWNAAHLERLKWKRRRETLLKFARDCDIILMKEFRGKLEDFNASLPQLVGTFFVAVSPGPSAATDGTAVLVRRSLMRHTDVIQAQEVVAGRIARLCLRNASRCLTAWSVHNFGWALDPGAAGNGCPST